MSAYQQGDASAFDELYRRYSAKVYGYLSSKIPERSIRDDIFQATFLKLHQSRARYDRSYPFAPWLFTICRNTFLDAVRKVSRTEVNLPTELVEEVSPAPEVLDLSSLSESQRRALELRYSEGFSFEEIATRLNTSPVNVRQLVSRALKRLRKKSRR